MAMELPNLDSRLGSVADFVRQGAYVADIGSDHAYLPLWLVLSGRAARAIASDIVEGPVARAAANVSAYGAEDKVRVIRADGLSGVKGLPITDVVIAGMGGELIADIISSAEWVFDAKYRLILQPMTHSEILRRELLARGFLIIDETLTESADGKRIYTTLCAEYNGESTLCEWSAGELLFGKKNIERGGELFEKYCARLEKQYTYIKDSKGGAGEDTSAEDEILKFLFERKKQK